MREDAQAFAPAAAIAAVRRPERVKMSASSGRVLIAAMASLVMLSGCETSSKLGDLMQSREPDPPLGSLEDAARGEPATTGTVGTLPDGTPQATSSGLLGSDPNDDLSLGKKHYRAANYGLAERHFRRAVESHPRDAEAWVGLAASYDRLRRFDLADRAYREVIGIIGETPEVLNNKGYSYILRGDYPRAREILLAAQAKDPNSPYIRNNLELLEKSFRGGKAVQ
jgi:Flp pilus assembly protein TadD